MMTDAPVTSGDDASIAECQKYLSGFRVQELKELLKFLGCGQSGKKMDLYVKAMELLQTGNPKVRKKIRDITRKVTESRNGGQFFVKKKIEAQVLPAPTLPSVVFKSAPFYERISTVLGPTDLVNRSVGSFPCSTRLQFSLTLQEIQILFPVGPSGSSQHPPHILVRFCRKDPSCPQDDQYPPQCSLKVNEIPCSLPGYHPFKPEHKPDAMKVCSPVNITHSLKSVGTMLNTIVINWFQSGYSQFCVTVELSKPLTVQDMLHKLVSKGLLSAAVSQSLVKQKLVGSKDVDVSATTSHLRVSLLCPLGRKRMEYPCRSEHCTHLQCFDAKAYLQMNEKKARWVCPICDKSARFETLVIDKLFFDICDVSQTDDVEFLEDGTWHPIHKRVRKWATPEKGVNCIILNSPDALKVKDEQDLTSEPIMIDLTQSEDDGSPVSHASSNVLSPHRIYLGSPTPNAGGKDPHIPSHSSSPPFRTAACLSHTHTAPARHVPVLMQNNGPNGPSCSTLVVNVNTNTSAGSVTSSLVTRTSSGVVSVD